MGSWKSPYLGDRIMKNSVGRPPNRPKSDRIYKDSKMEQTQKQAFDLSTFEKVTLYKNFEPCKAPENIHEATQAVGGDTKKLLEIIHKGLISEQAKVVRNDPSGWMVEDEEDNQIRFQGIVADQKAVNSLVLTLAKTAFQYDKNASLVDRKASKAKAENFVRSNEGLKEGLKISAAAAQVE